MILVKFLQYCDGLLRGKLPPPDLRILCGKAATGCQFLLYLLPWFHEIISLYLSTIQALSLNILSFLFNDILTKSMMKY